MAHTWIGQTGVRYLMRSAVKCRYGILIAIVVVFVVAWPYIKMEFAESAHYAEQDRREYAFYTPDILKKMPRISPDYDFDFANIAGPATLAHAINFYGTEDWHRVAAYLTANNYVRQESCNIENVCWRGEERILTQRSWSER